MLENTFYERETIVHKGFSSWDSAYENQQSDKREALILY